MIIYNMMTLCSWLFILCHLPPSFASNFFIHLPLSSHSRYPEDFLPPHADDVGCGPSVEGERSCELTIIEFFVACQYLVFKTTIIRMIPSAITCHGGLPIKYLLVDPGISLSPPLRRETLVRQKWPHALSTECLASFLTDHVAVRLIGP